MDSHAVSGLSTVQRLPLVHSRTPTKWTRPSFFKQSFIPSPPGNQAKVWIIFTASTLDSNPFCLVWSSITNFRIEVVSYKYPIRISGKITTVPRLFSVPLTPNEKQTSDYERTHQMGLFDTHFVQFGQVFPISGLKLLVTSIRYV